VNQHRIQRRSIEFLCNQVCSLSIYGSQTLPSTILFSRFPLPPQLTMLGGWKKTFPSSSPSSKLNWNNTYLKWPGKSFVRSHTDWRSIVSWGA